MEVRLIVNPISGRGRGREAARRLEGLLQERGHRVAAQFTSAPGDAERFAGSLDRRLQRLVVVGGDGTVNEVLNGLVRLDLPVLVFPVGTSNLLATDLQLPGDPEAAARLLETGRIRRLDLGERDGRRFAAVVGVGFDGEVVRRLALRRRGPIRRWSYLGPIAAALRSLRTTRLRVLADGRLLAEDTPWVLCCNVRTYAAYFHFAPAADPWDGALDLVFFRRRSAVAVARAALRACLHRPPPADVARVERVHRITIEADGSAPAPCEVDGDQGGTTPVRIQIRPALLPLVVP